MNRIKNAYDNVAPGAGELAAQRDAFLQKLDVPQTGIKPVRKRVSRRWRIAAVIAACLILGTAAIALSKCILRTWGIDGYLWERNNRDVSLPKTLKESVKVESEWAGWTLDQYLEGSSCIFYGKCTGKTAGDRGSSELRFDIERVYKGVYDPEVERFCSILREPFKEGVYYLIFCGRDASVYTGTDCYGISTVIFETDTGLYHEGVFDLKEKDMNEVLATAESYASQHPAADQIVINNDYCRSDDLREIYDYASTVAVMKITGIADITAQDRTAYTFEVKELLKGSVKGEQWVIAFKDSMAVGEEYLLLLDKPEDTSVFFIMCSARSVLAASGAEAETVRSFSK